MAKKKDDEIEDNNDFNEENQNDFNEADDNFGLPEVEYQPLDESTDDTTEESTDSEDQSDYSYSSSTSESEDSPSYGYPQEEESQEEQQDEKPAYVPGSYTPPQQESSNAGKIVGIIFVALLLAAAGWYFGIYSPAQKEKARIEKQKEDEAEAKRLADEQKAEEERIAKEEAEREAARLAAEQAEAAKSKVGTIETITSRTGRYYVVITSAIDGDLAMDYANKLSKNGVNVQLIPPFGKSKFHRVTVDNLDTWASAENRANELKSEYGESVWVIKY